MQFLKPLSWLISLGLHGAIVAFAVVTFTGSNALDAGSGDDMFMVEQGISIEGVTNFGEAEEMIELADIPPMQATQAPPEIPEVEPELTEVISSTQSTTEAPALEELPEPVDEEKPEEVAVEEQAAQVAKLIEKSSGQAQEGGDSNLLREYKGLLRKAIGRVPVKPRTRRKGSVLLRFSVGPSGDLILRTVEESSGSKALDEAALAALDRTKFPPMPDELTGEPVEATIRFNFRTKKRR
jgi:periplasmic protein TonB